MFQTKRPPFFPPLPRPLDRLCVDEVEVRSIRNRISVTMQTERFWIRRFRMSIVDDGDHVQLIGWCCCRIRGDAECVMRLFVAFEKWMQAWTRKQA